MWHWYNAFYLLFFDINVKNNDYEFSSQRNKKYRFQFSTNYRYDSEKREGCGVVAHERLTEPRVTMDWLLAIPRSFSNLTAFFDLNGRKMWLSPKSDTVTLSKDLINNLRPNGTYLFQNLKLNFEMSFSRLFSAIFRIIFDFMKKVQE